MPFKRRREVARIGKEELKERYPRGIKAGDSIEYANMWLARADTYRKKGKYLDAVDALNEAEDSLSDDPYITGKVLDDEAVKYGKAIKSRAQRLIKEARGPDAAEVPD